MLMLAAERNGSRLTKNKALALAQYVLPKHRQREIGPDYNPTWMSSEGRLEAEIEKLRAALPAAAPEAGRGEAQEAAPPAAAPEPAPGPGGEEASGAAATGEPQAGLFSEPSSAPALQRPPAAEAASADGMGTGTEAASARPSGPPGDIAATPAAVPAPAASPAVAASEPAPASALQPADTPAVTTAEAAAPATADALATLGAGALADAFRSVLTKALAGLLSDVLRQPEVQAALRDALASAMPPRRPAQEAPQAVSRPAVAAGPAQGERRVPRDAAEAAPARPHPSPPGALAKHPGGPLPPAAGEREIDDEPPPSDPYAWQHTPLDALPQRTARGASELPKPTVLVFGLLPRDQHKLRADFGQKYHLRFGSPDKAKHAGDIVKKADKVYALVRFIPKDLDRSLAASGVPYAPLGSIGELRQELTINPPLPRAEMG